MPQRIKYHRPKGMPDAGKVYERQKPRQEDKNFYAGTRWRKLRAAFLAEHPLCNGEGCNALALHVDHVQERKDRPEMSYDWDNLQGLCQPCHNRKRGMK